VEALCRISISRFYRDRAVFDAVADRILPSLATAASARGDGRLRVWSAGCAGGEEPYTVALIWQQAVSARAAGLALELVATDADPVALERARRACYRGSSLKEVPASWRAAAFTPRGDLFCLADEVRAAVELRCQDLRQDAPEGPFSLILCRNLAFTYFGEAAQREVAARLGALLTADGVLVIGAHERLPPGTPGLVLDPAGPGACVFRRAPSPPDAP
jgi:chemotaxis protein methyltransferase CheR